MHKPYLISISIYLGLAPIYWFPSLPPIYVFAVKYFFFISIVIYSLLFSLKNKSFYFPKLWGLYILIFMGLYLSVYVIFGSHIDNLLLFINIIQIILFLNVISVLIEIDKVDYVITLSLKLLTFLVSVAILLMLLSPEIINPFNDNTSILDSAFGNSRTGWGPSISLYIPLLLLVWGNYYSSCLYIFSILLTGGRTGLLISMFSLTFTSFAHKKRRMRIAAMIIFIISLIFIVPFLIVNFTEYRALEIFDFSNYKDDEFNSGRSKLIYDAIMGIRSNWLFGNGLESHFIGESVHNVFVRLWLFYGITFFILSLILPVYICLRAFFLYLTEINAEVRFWYLCLSSIVISGFMIGLAEPKIIFGNFNAFAMWWFAFGLIASEKFRLSLYSKFKQ